MNIGVFTVFGEGNFGVNMQSSTVYNKIAEKYPDSNVEFINVQPRDKDFFRVGMKRMCVKSVLNDIKKINKCKSFKNGFSYSNNKLVTKKYSEAIEFIKNINYDMIFVGSDTILKFYDFHVDGNVPYFWLSEKIKAKKILIAASSCNTSINDLDEKSKNILRNSINDFDKIGIRDEATKTLISNVVPEREEGIVIIPDPTFAFEIDYRYAEEYIRNSKIRDEKWVFLHPLANDRWVERFCELCHNDGYKVASMKKYNGIDLLINDIGPLEHAGIFKYFEFVVTPRFHDSVFAFKNHVPVVCVYSKKKYSNENGDSKYTNLFSYFGYKDSGLINSDNNVDGDFVYEKSIGMLNSYNKDNVSSVLSELRSRFNKYVASV